MTTTLPRLESGIPGLDKVLQGGFVQGASYIVQGEPGAGKTIFANQVAFANAMFGRKVLYVTLLAETHDRLFQSLSTLEFFDKARLGSDIAYVSVFQALRDDGLSAVVSLLRKETHRHKATLLVFDGLLNARDSAVADIDIKTFVAELQSQAAFVGCTVLFLASSRLADESPEHTMVDGVIELRDELIGVRSARRLQVKKSRGTSALGGFHQYEINDAGLTVYPRLERLLGSPSVSDQPSEVLLASGISGLDALIGGGLRSGSVSLLFGPSGGGKTSMGLSFLNAAKEEEPALHFGFYETPARLLLKAKTLGLDLQPKVDCGHLELLWQPMTENLLDKLGSHLLEAVARRKVKRLHLDGLGGFVRAAFYPHRLVEFFTALSNELRALDVTTLATWELHDLFGPTVSAPGHEISSILDNLMLVRQVEYQSQLKRALTILKIRDQEHDPYIHEIGFGNKGIEIRLPLQSTSGATTGVATP